MFICESARVAGKFAERLLRTSRAALENSKTIHEIRRTITRGIRFVRFRVISGMVFFASVLVKGKAFVELEY